jgi:arylsulfatase A-like enzyme
MNFEAVNMAQQLAGDGYLDAQGTPSPALAGAFDHLDQSLGNLVAELGTKNLLQSTLIIITAKHGQAPIDPSNRLIVDRHIIPNLVNSVQPGLLAQATQDDVSLLWLTDQSKTETVVATLNANKAQAHLDSILAGTALTTEFDNPLTDPRTPDIIGLPTLGVIYANTTSTKLAAHGGFSDDDTHVPLLVSNPALATTTVDTAVHTTQIAPTILSQLGLAPSSLQAENTEPTSVLPIQFAARRPSASISTPADGATYAQDRL